MGKTPLKADEIHTTGLTERMTAFVVVAVVVSAMVLGAVISYEMNRLLLSEESAKLEADSHLITLQFREKLNDISSDMRVLARAAPVTRVVKGHKAAGRAENNRSDKLEWHRRLAALLAATLANGHHYLGNYILDLP